ncbi:hypothetical protein Q0N35_02790 [Priestia koreensis]|nr:hypothetical protein [Priestia koreensis]
MGCWALARRKFGKTIRALPDSQQEKR